jgi:hypothetical protein
MEKPSGGYVFALSIGLGIIAFGLYERLKRHSHAVYTKGVITRLSKATAKGSRYLDYTFFYDTIRFYGSQSLSFCYDCKAGDTVIVRYEWGNPKNSDLVHEMPMPRPSSAPQSNAPGR